MLGFVRALTNPSAHAEVVAGGRVEGAIVGEEKICCAFPPFFLATKTIYFSNLSKQTEIGVSFNK